jgi:hypothetical protein
VRPSLKRQRDKVPLTDAELREKAERQLREMAASHARLLAAFLALRSLRSLSHSTEPALRIVRDRLTQFPDVFVDRLRLKNPAPMKRLLRAHCEHIIRDMDTALADMPDEPVTATYARYVDATNQLRPGDLESERQ